MKKILILLFLFLLVPVVRAEEEDLAPNAKSAIMIEASTGEILFQKNKDEKLAPASMTKMMSMLLIMEEIENVIYGLLIRKIKKIRCRCGN